MVKDKRLRILTSVGLLLVVLPNTLKEYIHIPDFFRGVFVGIGMAMMIYCIIIMKRKNVSA